MTNLDPLEIQPEYDYQFTTNAHGLVQLKELDHSKAAVLFLGDSFTDGQGAQPWFYRLEQEWPESSRYQLVNGGIVGTGVEAWGRLYKAMSTQVRVTKAVVIFISEDWTRVVWQFSKGRLRCLQAGAMCEGPEDFYGLSEDPIEAEAQIDHIARYRIDYLSRLRESTNVISRSSTYQNLLWPTFERLMRFKYTHSFETRDTKQFETSKNVVAGIVADLGRDNVLFIYLPQKSELETGPGSFGRKAIDFIAQRGFAFVDGRAKCGLSLGDYYQRDGHPNADGYAKIATCVRDAVTTVFHR
jgi:lysophospholipase L1-like esterase